MLSFEASLPKNGDGYERVSEAVKAIAALSPDYMSVTYGTGGTNAGMATAIATEIQRDYGVTSLAHFSCISSAPKQREGALHVYAMNKPDVMAKIKDNLSSIIV